MVTEGFDYPPSPFLPHVSSIEMIQASVRRRRRDHMSKLPFIECLTNTLK